MGSCFRIVDWVGIYERPDDPDKPKKTRRGVRPLTWVQLQVHGHSLGEGWRLLARQAGSERFEVFGFFCKLLELAADEPLTRRDGTLYFRGQPADVGDIAFMLDTDEATVHRLIGHLVAVAWVESFDADLVRAIARNGQTQESASPQTQNHCAQLRATPKLLYRSETEEEELDKRPKTPDAACAADSVVARGASSVSGSAPSAPSPASEGTPPPPPPPAAAPAAPATAAPTADDPTRGLPRRTGPPTTPIGQVLLKLAHDKDDDQLARSDWSVVVRRWTHSAICILFGIDASGGDPQTNADHTTIRRALMHACARHGHQPKRGAVRSVLRELVTLAQDKATAGSLHKPLAAWVAEVKKRYGDWNETTPGPAALSPQSSPMPQAHLSAPAPAAQEVAS